MRKIERFGATLLAAAVLSAPASAADWPQYRGPAQDGQSPETGVFGSDAFGLAEAWKRPLGRGYSSVLIADGTLVTMYGDEDSGVSWVLALDPDSGEERWRYRVGEYYPAHTGSEGGPSSSPTIEDGVVYGVGRFGKLFALDLADGTERWSVDFEGAEWATTPHYGWTTSPVIVGSLVTLLTGGVEGHTITAFDRETGKRAWSTGDGNVSYQTPAVLELAGHTQLVAVNDRWMFGFDPATGEELWKHEHGTFTVEAFAQPLPIGKDRFLINSLAEAVAYEIRRTDDGYAVSETWRTAALKSSYAVPVFHEGSVFGFSRSILVCLDAATGEVRWKSREPGGRGLILVDGHLVILDPDGAVAVVEATASGYVERARLATLDRYSHAPPSFANGRIYVRNETAIAAVGVTTKRPDDGRSRGTERRLAGAFGDLVRRAEAAEDPAAVVEAYLAKQDSFPIVEDDTVHFVYRDDVDAVGLSGTFSEWWDPVEMDRIAGTDVFFLSMRLDPGAVWEYRFHPDFERRTHDPRNPLRIGPGSELRMPGWRSPEHLAEPEGDRGRIDSFEFRSDVLGETRRIRLYLPVGYARSDARYPVLFAQSGNQALDVAGVDRTLDNLIGESVRPVIVVFLPAPRSLEEMAGRRTADLSRMVVDELLPHVDRHYRTIASREARAMVGPSDGGMLALHAVLTASDRFGMVAVQSGHMQVRIADELRALIESAEAPRPTVFLQWTANDTKFGEGGIDAEAGSTELHRRFTAAGFGVLGGERPGSSGWSTWRAYWDDILAAFFPSEPEG